MGVGCPELHSVNSEHISVLRSTYEDSLQLRYQAELFRSEVDIAFPTEIRFKPKKYTRPGELTITMDEYFNNVLNIYTFRRGLKVNSQSTKINKSLTGKKGRPTPQINDASILARAYNRNYVRSRVSLMFKGLKLLYPRRALCEAMDDFDLDVMKTEKYLVNLGTLSFKALDLFESAVLRIPKECRKTSTLWDNISHFHNSKQNVKATS